MSENLRVKRVLFLRKHKSNAIIGRLILRTFLSKVKPRWPWRFDFTGFLVWKSIQLVTLANCKLRKHEVEVEEYQAIVYRGCRICDRTWVVKC